jgi:hypothetical protein
MTIKALPGRALSMDRPPNAHNNTAAMMTPNSTSHSYQASSLSPGRGVGVTLKPDRCSLMMPLPASSSGRAGF